MSWIYLVIGQFQDQTAASDAAPLPLLPPLVLTVPPLNLIIHVSPILLSPGSVFEPASEEEAVTVVVEAVGGTSVPSIPIVPHLCSLLNNLRTLPKLSFVFDHSEYPCRSLVSPTPKLLEQRYSHRLVVITCQYFLRPPPSFHPILTSILRPKLVESDSHSELR